MAADAELGDALRALERLQPADAQTAFQLLTCLGLRPDSGPSAKAPTGPRLPLADAGPAPEPAPSPAAAAAQLVNDAAQLPPLLPSLLEEIAGDGSAPPPWLTLAVSIPLPGAPSNPFKRHEWPLFEAKWQRAIITKLASRPAPLGEPDVPRIVDRIAAGAALAELPRRPLATTAGGLQLLVDQSESLEPFKLDAAELVRAFRRIVGPARVSVQAFQGLPEWGCMIGAHSTSYRPPPAGAAVVVVSDLGVGPAPPTAAAASPAEWGAFFARLTRRGHRCVAVVPRDPGELRRWARSGWQFVAWDRHTLASSLGPATTDAGYGTGEGAPPADNVRALDALAVLGSGARDLACVASLAARIEPQLLRLLRCRLVTDAPVATEAELWFSGLVAERAATGIVLRHAEREVLQRLLRSDRSRLDAAYALIENFHRDSAPALRIEEELAYRTLVGDLDTARRLLRSMLVTLIDPLRPGVSKWLNQALLRLPSGLQALEETRMLALGTALRTGEAAPLPAESAAGGAGWHWLKPTSRDIELSVNLRQGALEFAPRTVSGAHRLRVPDAGFVLIEILTGGGPQPRLQRVRVNPGARTWVPIEGYACQINVIGGGSWQLRVAEVATRRSVSGQRFIARNRAPRVHIDYEVETYGAIRKLELPFIIGILADLSGHTREPPLELAERRFRAIDMDNFDAVMGAIKPRAAFRVPNTLIGQGELVVDLEFRSLDDFTPSAIARRLEPLRRLLDARTQLHTLLTDMDGKPGAEELIARVLADPAMARPAVDAGSSQDAGAKAAEGSDARVGGASEAFDRLLQEHFKPKTDQARNAIARAVATLIEQAAAQTPSPSSAPWDRIRAIITSIDGELTAQINPILHHESFRTLEGAWRGLFHLVTRTETGASLKLRILDVSKAELARNLSRYPDSAWDQSPLFKNIYEMEFGVLGGEPYGCLVGDYQFDHSDRDVALLGQIARIAAAAHAPFLAAAAPSLLQLNSWQDLSTPRDLNKIVAGPDHAAWRSLRESQDAHYVSLSLPRFLARLPYGGKTLPIEEFAFEEASEGGDDSSYCWANSAFAMAGNVANAFSIYGWCAAIRGVESGGMVEGLPVHVFPTDDGTVDTQCPTEIAIADRRENELSNLGLNVLLHRRNTDTAVFISAATLHMPSTYENVDATDNARLAARLPVVFATSRIAHYLMCIVRDKIGSFATRDDMQRWLSHWLAQYVGTNPYVMSEAEKAQRPLAEARVEIQERVAEQSLSAYRATLYLRPYYQIEGLKFPVRIQLQLPAFRP